MKLSPRSGKVVSDLVGLINVNLVLTIFFRKKRGLIAEIVCNMNASQPETVLERQLIMMNIDLILNFTLKALFSFFSLANVVAQMPLEGNTIEI